VEELLSRERDLKERVGDKKEISRIVYKRRYEIDFMDEIFFRRENVNSQTKNLQCYWIKKINSIMKKKGGIKFRYLNI
jgi:hypothetical protein